MHRHRPELPGEETGGRHAGQADVEVGPRQVAPTPVERRHEDQDHGHADEGDLGPDGQPVDPGDGDAGVARPRLAQQGEDGDHLPPSFDGDAATAFGPRSATLGWW